MLLVAPVLLAFHIHVSEMLDSLLFASCSIVQEQQYVDAARKQLARIRGIAVPPLESPII